MTTLYNELGYYPSVQEVADYLGITVEKYQEAMRKAAVFNILSLDIVLAEAQENKTSAPMPKSEEGEQPENRILKKKYLKSYPKESRR